LTSAIELLVILVFKVETIRKIICTVKYFQNYLYNRYADRSTSHEELNIQKLSIMSINIGWRCESRCGRRCEKTNQNITIGWRCERSCEKGQEKDMTKSEKM
jgi:hypothetical protein